MRARAGVGAASRSGAWLAQRGGHQPPSLLGPLHVGLVGPWASMGWAAHVQAPHPPSKHMGPKGRSHATTSDVTLEPRAQ